MPSLNRVFLIGNLTRDPEVRYIPSGTAVTTFSIAVNRIYNQQNGERKEEVCFVRIVTWAKLAQSCGEFLNKGSAVFVEGRLQSRSWEAQDGSKRSTIEVVAQRVQFLGKPSKAVATDAEKAAETPADLGEEQNLEASPDEQVPF